MDIATSTIAELSGKIKAREVSIEEVTKASLDRVKQTEAAIDAYLDVYEERALNQARELDKNLNDDVGPLYGIPVSLKDLLLLKGERATASSKILENYVASYTATCVTKLEEAGTVFLGKTNCDEFAMGASTETSAYKMTKNPWDPERVPGGSSGGSAASVAAGSSVFSLGTDTGGSIRQPAALCGITGLKPTYGRVSRYGVIAMASGLDQVGPFARTVEDAALVLETIAGHDKMDATSLRQDKTNFVDQMKQDIKGLRIGVPTEYFGDGLDPEIEEAVREGIKELEKQGAEVKEISLPLTKYALPVYYVVVPSEVSSNMSKYDGIRYGAHVDGADLQEVYMNTRSEKLGKEVKRRILIGAYALSSGYYDAYYKKAQQVRRLLINDFQRAFAEVDVIASPTSPVPAFKMHERSEDPLSMYLSDIYTVSANLAGLPGVSVPCGFTKSGLPIGMQFMADQMQEGNILRAGYAYQQATDWHTKHPEV